VTLGDRPSPLLRERPVSEKTKYEKLFEEWRADYAAGKREDAHRYGKETLQKIFDGTTEAAAADQGKDKGIER
jgi:hypothetical protein